MKKIVRFFRDPTRRGNPPPSNLAKKGEKRQKEKKSPNGILSNKLKEKPPRPKSPPSNRDIEAMRAQGAVPRTPRTSVTVQSPISQVQRAKCFPICEANGNPCPSNNELDLEMEPFMQQHQEIENIHAPGDYDKNRCNPHGDFEYLPSYPSSERLSLACALPEIEWKLPEFAANESSVTALQGRLVQMEEAHHSTNEELQATLQELADLQSQLAHFQSNCERLGEEKHVLLESLCRQTEKLEDARDKVDTLQELLLEEQGEAPGAERELKLVDLLKSAQEERETLLLKQEELNNQLNELRNTATSDEKTTSRLEERINVLESAYNGLKAEREQVEGQLATSKEETNALTIEVNRLNTLLDHAKAKICDLEQTRSLTDKSDLEELIDMSRKEKDNLETQVAHLQEQLSKSICEVNKLTEQVHKLQEDLKVSRNNAKSAMSDMEYNMEQMKKDWTKVTQEHQESLELIKELQVQMGCHVEDKKQLESVLCEAQKSLAASEKKQRDMDKQRHDETTAHNSQTLEWEQFQSDLLVTVRVANDMKNDALSQLDVYAQENTLLRDKLKSMETQIEKFKAKAPSTTTTLSDTSASVLCSVQQDLATRRSKPGFGKQDNRLSVKSLIESIENATKHAKAGPGSSTSMPALGMSSDGADLTDSGDNDLQTRAAGDDTQQNSTPNALDFERPVCFGESGEKDPLLRLAKNGGSKRNALLKWCQTKTIEYPNIDITNFSTSWNDGLALCALMHTYLPSMIPYDQLTSSDPVNNFSLAFKAAESVGIPTTPNLGEMVQTEKPDWKLVMDYITAIYKRFES